MLKGAVLILCSLWLSSLETVLAADNPTAERGHLVIVGGGLKDDNRSVYRAFLDAARDGPIYIIPAATRSPASSAEKAKDAMIKHGINRDRVIIAPLAVHDDKATDEDESAWSENATDPELAARLQGAGGFWFTGGSQRRITALLLTEDGSDTPALTAIRAAHDTGAVIGGTSAGAAIMSQQMIAGGRSLPTLLHGSDRDADNVLSVTSGLGFFTYGLIDQHFTERARFGRLIAALAEVPAGQGAVGFGIDEDTALIVHADGGMTVRGAGYVTIADARNARLARTPAGTFKAQGVILHLVSAGDEIDAPVAKLTPAPYKDPTIGNEYNDREDTGSGGMALAGQNVPSVIGDSLVDNKGSTSIERLSFDRSGKGIAYRFNQGPQTKGYWGRGPDGKGRFTAINIDFEIQPLKVRIQDEN